VVKHLTAKKAGTDTYVSDGARGLEVKRDFGDPLKLGKKFRHNSLASQIERAYSRLDSSGQIISFSQKFICKIIYYE
jgi:hypothetical protein